MGALFEALKPRDASNPYLCPMPGCGKSFPTTSSRSKHWGKHFLDTDTDAYLPANEFSQVVKALGAVPANSLPDEWHSLMYGAEQNGLQSVHTKLDTLILVQNETAAGVKENTSMLGTVIEKLQIIDQGMARIEDGFMKATMKYNEKWEPEPLENARTTKILFKEAIAVSDP